jgi:hypothetical protein
MSSFLTSFSLVRNSSTFLRWSPCSWITCGAGAGAAAGEAAGLSLTGGGGSAEAGGGGAAALLWP